MSELRTGGGGATPSRAVLTALRAAAVLIVATGLNDIIAGAVETYEPLYLYLAAIALVTFLDGFLIGAVTAAIATFLYALLFGPRPPRLDASVLLPAITGALAVVVAAGIAAIARRTRRKRVPMPEPAAADDGRPLLEASIVGPAEEIVTALEEMRADLRGTLSELSASRDRERSLELELRAARVAASEDAERIVAGANRAIDALSSRVQQIEEHAREREKRVEELLTARVRELETAADRAGAEVVALRLEISQLTNEREAARMQLAELRQRMTELHAALDVARRESAGRGVESQSRIDALTAERDAARTASSAVAQRVEELRTALDAARHESADRIAALQSAVDMLTAERDAAQATSASLAQRVEELESAIETTSDQSSADVVAARLEISQLRQHIAELEAGAASAQTAFDEKLQSIVSHLAEDHEQDLGNALMEKEAARAEARGITSRLTQLQQKIEEEQAKWIAQKQALTEKLQVAEDRAARAVEDTTRVMADARQAWQSELDRLRARVAELERPPVAPVDLSAPIPMPPPPGEQPGRILVTHPDPDLRQAARTSLQRLGYEVLTAGDGLECLRVAIAMQPDIIIADAVMPKMDGRELCQLLKSQEKTAHIKVVLLTRNADEHIIGADEVLKKPVPFDVLRSALSSLLAR